MANQTKTTTVNTQSVKPESIKKTISMDYTEVYELESLDQRKLYINSDIDEAVIDTIVFHILRYNNMDKGIPKENRIPIILYINSPGGTVSDGYGLIDAIITSKTPVYTVNQAMCASMGFLIFLAGEKRYSMPHAEFLMHDGSTFGYGSTAKMKDRMEFEAGQLEKMTKDYVLKRTKITEKKYDEKYRVEWYMLPSEAKENGVTQYIIGEDCDIDDIL